ncbi:glycosyltransferase family 39 protein [uncultured Desulfobulbus sp.]|uniref:glycosyltransferase family 39 protein n=1 Tax=uncultured Desulfobulbus sp. TaxID=239745 RepID=UPI0029C67F26|nr:glycosyltransferase family 39 protein [uncultured Desulfobulbus sp.]
MRLKVIRIILFINFIVSLFAIYGIFSFPFYKEMMIGYVPVILGVVISFFTFYYRKLLQKYIAKCIAVISEKQFLFSVFLLSILVRLPWIYRPGIIKSDFQSYFDGALGIIEGNGFGIGGQYPPGPSGYVATVFFFFGVSSYAVPLFNAILSGVASIIIYFLLRGYDVSTARLASFLVSIIPSSAVFAGALGYENFLLFAFPSILLIFTKTQSALMQSILLYLIFLGLLCGIVVLTHPPYILLPFIIGIGFWISGLSLKKSAVRLSFIIIIVFMVIAPWMYHTYKSFNKPFISANFGRVLLSSNNPYTDGIFSDLYPPLNTENIVSHDERMAKLAFNYIINNPFRVILLSLKRTAYMWGTDTTTLGAVLDGRELEKKIMSLITQTFWVVIVLFWLSWSWKAVSSKVSYLPSFYYIALIWIFIKFSIHFLIEPSSRHHLELIPILIFIAADNLVGINKV